MSFTQYNAFIKGDDHLNERIKAIRKEKKLTQSEFGAIIGVKGNTITNYESGNRAPSDAVIFSICREFNVNESWLRTGEGKMFREDERPIYTQLAEQYHLSDAGERVIRTFCELPDEHRRIIEQFILSAASNIQPNELAQVEQEYQEHEKTLNTKNTSDGASKTG